MSELTDSGRMVSVSRSVALNRKNRLRTGAHIYCLLAKIACGAFRGVQALSQRMRPAKRVVFAGSSLQGRLGHLE